MRRVSRALAMVLLIACGTRPVVLVQDAGVVTDAGAVQDAGVATDAGTTPEDAGAEDAGVTEDAGTDDADRDGLPDALEQRLARDHLPNLSLHPQDACPLGGIIYRARPHPLDATLVLILYDHLYERDCGLGGHVGDNETFAVTVNPANGVTAMKAISHQNTPCQKITSCGTCSGLAACDVADGGHPRVYASRDKHGTYVQKSGCTTVSFCPDDCTAGEQLGVPLINVGEPNAHLVEDLTDAGFITTANGWTRTELFHFDPWGPNEFGTAGKPSGDLVDEAFSPPPCH